MTKIEQVDEEAYAREAFITFLRTLLDSSDPVVVIAAGALLQDLGEEPADE